MNVIEVDEHDNVIGNRHIKDFFKSKHIHRSSHLLLFNAKGELLVQKRSLKKKLFPGRYEYSVAGFVDEGESYDDCIKREMKEELRISIPVTFLFKYKYFDDIDKAFKSVYRGEYDGEITPNDEIESYEWMSLHNLKESIENNPEHYNPSFLEGLQIFFSKQ